MRGYIAETIAAFRSPDWREQDEALPLIGWKTPDTLDGHRKRLPDASGLYIIAVSGRDGVSRPLYVGQSCNLRKRLRQHPVAKVISDDWRGAYITRWFRPCPAEDLHRDERDLISTLKPVYNVCCIHG